eukprot:GHVL01036072.1.p1 GENE.GHVL01036072.1~~GHVL01036072.1.p1  ORF type:complete len:534 (+),score=74.62 GHVL01036072.1:46-1647(+)
MTARLWPRCELFDHGSIQTNFKLNPAQVLECLSGLNRDTVQYEHWADAVAHSFHPTATEREAQAYWQVYTTLISGLLNEERKRNYIDIEHLGILMMIQCYNVKLRKQEHNTEIAWPTSMHSPRSSGASPRSQVATSSRHRDPSSIHQFIIQNLTKFIQIITKKYTSVPISITSEEFEYIHILLDGCIDNNIYKGKLYELCTIFEQSVLLDPLIGWIERHLTWNDSRYPEVPRTPSETTIIFSSSNKGVIIKDKKEMKGVELVYFTGCSDLTVYLTGRAPFVSVTGCKDCSITLCAVPIILSISQSEKLKVHAVSNLVKLESVLESRCFLDVNVQPILSGDSRGIQLGPCDIVYSNLTQLHKESSMHWVSNTSVVENWAKPLLCSPSLKGQRLTNVILSASPTSCGSPRASSEVDDDSCMSYSFCHPEAFVPRLIPSFVISNNVKGGTLALCDGTNSGKLTLPQCYANPLQQKLNALSQRVLAKKIEAGGPQVKGKIQDVLTHCFSCYLQKHPLRLRQIHELIKQEQSLVSDKK